MAKRVWPFRFSRHKARYTDGPPAPNATSGELKRVLEPISRSPEQDARDALELSELEYMLGVLDGQS